MEEIERKILEINKKEVEKKLTELGAEKTFEGLLRVCYLDTPNGEIRKRGDLLRVRQFEDKHTEVVYKTNKRIKKGCKVYDEYSFKGESFDEAVAFFKCLGFELSCSYEKKRTSYYYQDSEIEIDEYPKIPAFLEIESKDPKQIDTIVNFLGLTSHESSTETINELLRRKYPKIKLNNLKFT